MPVDMETYEQEALAELAPPARSAETQALAEIRDELRASRTGTAAASPSASPSI